MPFPSTPTRDLLPPKTPPGAPRIYSVKPILAIARGPLDVALDGLAVAAFLYVTVVLATSWAHIPERVPTHFGDSGQADGFGPRNTLLIMPAMTVVTFALFTILSRFPHRFNYPFAITLENAEREYQLAVHLMSWLKLEITGLFAYLTWVSVQVALGQASGLDPSFPIIAGIVTVGTVGMYFYLSYRARS